jgi:hypothetical protein
VAEERHTTTLDIKVDDRQIVELGKELERTFSVDTLVSFNKMMDRQTKVLDSMIKQQKNLQAQLKETSKTFAPTATGSAVGAFLGTRLAGGGGQPHPREVPKHKGHGLAQGSMHFGGTLSGAALKGNIGERLIEAMPGIGEIGAAAVEGGMEMYQQFIQQMEAQMEAFGATGLGRGGQGRMAGVGARLGLSPAQSAAMMGQFAGQTGLTGEALGGVGGRLMEMDRLGGAGGVAGVIGAAGAAGGDVGGGRANALVENAVGSGLIAGIREAKLDQFLQSISNSVEGMRTQGIMLTPESMLSMVRALGASGLRGAQATRAATDLAQGAQRAIFGSGAFTQMLYEAAGVTGQEGGTGLTDAVRMLEADPVKFMMKALSQMQERMPNVPIEELAMQMRGVAAQQGVQMTFTEMEQIMKGARRGDFREDAGLGEEAAAGISADFIGKRRRRSGAIRKEVAFEAQHQLREAQLGGDKRVKDMVQEIRHIDIAAVEKVLPEVSKVITGALHLAVDLTKAYNEAGLGGVGRELARKAVETNVEPAVQRILTNNLNDRLARRQQGTSEMQGFENPDQAAQHAHNIEALGMTDAQSRAAILGGKGGARKAGPSGAEQAAKHGVFRKEAAPAGGTPSEQMRQAGTLMIAAADGLDMEFSLAEADAAAD